MEIQPTSIISQTLDTRQFETSETWDVFLIFLFIFESSHKKLRISAHLFQKCSNTANIEAKEIETITVCFI